VLRERGTLYQQTGELIRNDYALKLINKTQDAQVLLLSAEGPAGVNVQLSGAQSVPIAAGDVLNMPISLTMPRNQLTTAISTVVFRVCPASESRCITQTSRFFAPEPTAP
jgi:polyferredoxin